MKTSAIRNFVAGFAFVAASALGFSAALATEPKDPPSSANEPEVAPGADSGTECSSDSECSSQSCSVTKLKYGGNGTTYTVKTCK